ncbi:MAG: hypothetical protein K0R54_4150 [Clostridiaceae bacterium]|jgi:hypothetical protein|nr:hypothetical protein [Clostridiaceae bacterium]
MRFFKKTDLIVIFLIVIISAVCWIIYNSIFSKKTAKAEIYYNNSLVKTVNLKTGVDKRFSIPQNRHVVFHLYKDRSIQFEESDCPDKICIKTGKIKTVGQTAACIPNKIFLKIVSDDNSSNLDGFSGK